MDADAAGCYRVVAGASVAAAYVTASAAVAAVLVSAAAFRLSFLLHVRLRLLLLLRCRGSSAATTVAMVVL